MASPEISSHELLQRLQKEPDNEELIHEVATRINDPAYQHEIEHAAYAKLLQPTSCNDLLNAVKEQTSEGLHVRAVGSGHSFSNVCPTDGVLLDPHGMKGILPVDVSLFIDPSIASSLFCVESGITIQALNKALDKANRALANMGAYDGQTLAGAISTGTHGTGIGLGPIASSVRSLVLVSENKTIYRIEPSKGITDPTKFAKARPDIVLKQDDEWFNSNVVVMGCMGLIYSYTLEVMPAYYLQESRVLDTWEGLIRGSGKDSISAWLADPEVRHFEVDVNPYAVAGVHSCVKVIRKDVKGPAKGSRGIANWISGILASCPVADWAVVHFLNWFPTMCPTINSALKPLADNDDVDKSYVVTNVGAVDNVKAMALELSFDATRAAIDASELVSKINNLLSIFANAATNQKWYLAGPVALRFVAESDAYPTPQARRLEYTAELDLLVRIKNGEKLLTEVKMRYV